MRGKKTSLILRRVTETLDSAQAVVQTWQDKRIMKGVLTTLSGSEQNLYNKDTVVNMFKFITMKPIGITVTEKDIFIWGAKELKIISVTVPVNNRKNYEFILEEIT